MSTQDFLDNILFPSRSDFTLNAPPSPLMGSIHFCIFNINYSKDVALRGLETSTASNRKSVSIRIKQCIFQPSAFAGSAPNCCFLMTIVHTNTHTHTLTKPHTYIIAASNAAGRRAASSFVMDPPEHDYSLIRRIVFDSKPWLLLLLPMPPGRTARLLCVKVPSNDIPVDTWKQTEGHTTRGLLT